MTGGSEGLSVGDPEGLIVGDTVGDEVGDSVGASRVSSGTTTTSTGLDVGLDVGLGVGLGLGLASQLLSRFNVSFCMVTATSFPFELPSVISTFNRFEISLGAIQLAVYDDPLDDFVCSDAVTHDAELHGELSPLTTPAVACRNAPVPSPDSVTVTVVLALYDATAGVDTIAVVDVCTVMPMMLERWETSLPVAPLEVRVVRSH